MASAIRVGLEVAKGKTMRADDPVFAWPNVRRRAPNLGTCFDDFWPIFQPHIQARTDMNT